MLSEIIDILPPIAPLMRLFTGLLIGLFVASILESLNLTKPIARLAKPFVKYAHLSDISATSFAIALFSPASSNAYMGEKMNEGILSEKEAIVSNLFNSLPATIVHLPNIFFLAFPVLGWPAVVFVGLSLLAAILRSIATIFMGRFMLKSCGDYEETYQAKESSQAFSFKIALKKGLLRFTKRAPRIVFISIPIYCVIFYLQKYGFFTMAENWLVEHFGFSFLNPQSLGVIMLYMAAEMKAAIIAAAALFNADSISGQEVVLVLLIGNLLSAPMRGIRHQLPAYMGYYKASFAMKLIVANQAWRTLSILIVTIFYYLGNF